MYRFISALLSLCFFSFAFGNTPLPNNEAFVATVEQNGGTELAIHWHMPPGYHLYQERIHIKAKKPERTQFETIKWPPASGHMTSPSGEHLAVYTGDLNLIVPYTSTLAHMTLLVSYQGCASAGFCYPPTTREFSIPREGPYYTTLYPNPTVSDDIAPLSTKTEKPAKKTTLSTSDKVKQLLNNGNIWLLLSGFFAFGVLISLTPCVLPMIPILGSILVNSKGRHLLIKAGTYVLGMAVTYAGIGAAASFLGDNIQTALQQPWVIVFTSTLFVVFSLALFDCFSLSLPTGLSSRLGKWESNSRFAWIRVFLMGVLATLVLTPCVTPPLLGALLYIAKSGDVLRGASALFIMGIGMGIPLLIIAICGQRMLPKAGNWMNHIKTFLGFLMLAVAILTLARIIPHVAAQLLWIVWLLFIAVLLMRGKAMAMLRLPLAILVIAYASWLGAQTYYFGANTYLPIPIMRSPTHRMLLNKPKVIHSLDQLHHDLSHVPKGRLVMIRATADWCLTCQLMEAKVIPNPKVQQALTKVAQIRIDITKPSVDVKELMHHYQLIAPPVFLFFKDGKEIPDSRLIGEQSATHLAEAIAALK